MIRDNPRATPALIPVGRFGTVDELADVVVMLATNGYITGQTINVNDGWYNLEKSNAIALHHAPSPSCGCCPDQTGFARIPATVPSTFFVPQRQSLMPVVIPSTSPEK